jgi:hypothetical protein
MEFTLTLQFQLPSVDNDMDLLLERLGEEGCNDALVGVGQPGRVTLEFVRDGASAAEAMMTASEDVCRAIPCASLIKAA